MSDLLVNSILVVCLVIAAFCFAACLAGMFSAARAFARADRADAQPDLVSSDESDPVDAAGDTVPDWISRLRDDMTACEPSVLIDEIYAFLKEQAK